MKTILLIDDDKQVLVTFGAALRKNGYKVIEADSGVSGLAMARHHLPDLILSDINMPGGDGSTLLHDIRRDPELRSRQVVLMTGRPDLVTHRKGMEEGADDFLVKPFSSDSLLNCLKSRFSRASVSWRVEDQTLAQLRTLVPPNLPHECFTPLAGIIGLTEILLSDSFGSLPDEVRDIHNDIHLSALRLHRTLRNYLLILDLQSATSGNATLIPTSEVTKSIHAGVEEALRLNDRKADVKVRLNPCSILANPSDLSRIVEELVDNACKFSRQGTPVKVELEADGRLLVTDAGRGLTSEAINHIGAFHQFDRKKHEQQGLGLGLVLVQKLAAQCEAKFSLRSQPGKETQAQVAFSQPNLSGSLSE